MADYNRKEQLKEIHKLKRTTTKKKVDEAIQQLIKKSEKINFNSVAKEANLSKTTLYKYPEIRNRIEGLRTQRSSSISPKAPKQELQQNENTNALINSLKRRIKKLEDENKDLRQRLKVSYGEIYDKL